MAERPSHRWKRSGAKYADQVAPAQFGMNLRIELKEIEMNSAIKDQRPVNDCEMYVCPRSASRMAGTKSVSTFDLAT